MGTIRYSVEDRRIALLDLAKTMEHFASMLEEDAECDVACEATALDEACNRALDLGIHIKAEVTTILSALGDAKL